MKKIIKSLTVTGSAMLTAATGVFAAEPSVSPIEPGPSYFGDIGIIINKVLNFAMVLGALLVFMYLIWGGIEWITSGGDKGKTESARNKITAAIIGLIVLASAWAILALVLSFLNTDLATLLKFES